LAGEIVAIDGKTLRHSYDTRFPEGVTSSLKLRYINRLNELY